MERPQHFVGVDLASESFTASIWTIPAMELKTYDNLRNSIDGFEKFIHWLKQHQVTSKNSIICMEATGVYGERLCYFLASQGFLVAVEAPHKVKRAFPVSGHKTDHTDSQNIAEYAYRYHDELNLWHPRQQIIEQIAVLLATREQFTKQKTANTNSLKAIKRKHYQTPLVNELFENNITKLNESIQCIDAEIEKLIDGDTSFKQMLALLKTIPGVGMLLAANLLVLTQGFSQPMNYKKLSAYIGICPYEHSSGKSVYKRPRSAGFGPARVRKLLRLAALSVRTHHSPFKAYFLRKLTEGKSKNLILNNIANKLLRIICAIVNSKAPYISNYYSINPTLLKSA